MLFRKRIPAILLDCLSKQYLNKSLQDDKYLQYSDPKQWPACQHSSCTGFCNITNAAPRQRCVPVSGLIKKPEASPIKKEGNIMMMKIFKTILLISLITAAGCVPSNLTREDKIEPGSNIVFFNVILSGDKVSTIFIREKGNIYKGAGRVITANGDYVYGIILPQGEYEMAMIRSTKRADEIFGIGQFPAFTTKNDYINYGGTYTITVTMLKYTIHCTYDDESYKTAISKFKERYPDFSKQYQFRNAVAGKE